MSDARRRPVSHARAAPASTSRGAISPRPSWHRSATRSRGPTRRTLGRPRRDVRARPTDGKERRVAVVTMKQLLEAGVHFGHQTRRWNPKMKRFIFGERNGIYIIDLHQTLERDRDGLHATSATWSPTAARSCSSAPRSRRRTRSRATPTSAACRTSTSAGSAACSPTSRRSAARVKKMKEYERMRAAGDFEAMPKKEALILSRELEKLERNLGGIRNLDEAARRGVHHRHQEGAHRRHRGQQARPADRRRRRHQLRPRRHPVRHPRQRRRHPRRHACMCRVIADAVEEGRFIAAARNARPATTKADPGAGPLTPEEEAARAEQQAEARRQAAPAGPGARGPPGRVSRRARTAEPDADGPRDQPARRAAPRRPPPTAAAAERRADRHRDCPQKEQQPMADFTAKDVQRLRQDDRRRDDGRQEGARRRTTATSTPPPSWLREKGLAQAAKRSDRENAQGAVAVARAGNGRRARSSSSARPTSSAKAPDFVAPRRRSWPTLVAAKGEARRRRTAGRHRRPRHHAEGEHRARPVVRFEAADGAVLDTYLHVQNDRGVNGVLVELQGGDQELAHDVALHIAFAKPAYLTRDEVAAASGRGGARDARGPSRATRASPSRRSPRSSRAGSTAGSRSACCSSSRSSRTRSRRSQQLLGDATDRPLRPGRDRD